MQKDYFLGVHQKELERLKRQHLAWQPETQLLIQDANLPTCKNILDLGCGPGFTTLEIAEQCPNAHITGIDKADNYLQYLNHTLTAEQQKRIKTLHSDIVELENGKEQFDAAFCRWFLAFLIQDLPTVISNIYQQLKPNGVVAMMEYLTLDSFTCSPPNPNFDAHTKAWNAFYLNNGGDAKIGTYLPKLLTEAGFTIESQKCVGGFAPVHHRWWNWWRDAFENFAPTFVEQELMTQAAYNGLENYWAKQEKEGTGFIYSAVIVQIVAKKN